MDEPVETQTSPANNHQNGTVKNGVFAQVGSLLRALSTSPERRGIILMTIGIIIVICLTAVGQVRLNQWQGAFYDALEQRDMPIFFRELAVFAVIASFLLVLAVSQTWLHELMKVRLRQWLTHELLDEWLMPGRAHRLRFAGEIGVNPDQRMQEDTRHLTELSTSLGVGLLQASLLLVSFLGVLWVLSAQVVFVVSDRSFFIPGYMVWCALAFALAGSWLTLRIGRPLVPFHDRRYSREAELRFALVHINEHAEGISLYSGEPDERRLLEGIVRRLIAVMRRLAGGLAQLTWITSGYGWLAIIVPILVAAPGYFGGSLSFGGLMMVVGAFFQVQQSLRWFVDNFAGIADWRATLSRIATFRDVLLALEEPQQDVPQIELLDDPAGNLSIENLIMYLPSGRVALEESPVEIRPGEHVLIVGEQGSTTLVLALAGLWPWGTGTIRRPPRASMMFMPERPYLPLGTLGDAVMYPSSPVRFDEAETCATICAALEQVGLNHLTSSLDREARWDRTLSIDEQQQLAFARLLLLRPRWVILDDALSAQTEKSRQSLMSVFEGPLTETAVISASRAPELDGFYGRALHLRRLAGGVRFRPRSRRRAPRSEPASAATRLRE